jgi:hypothetical protein
MTGVVLRCPHCGTTRPTAGECEACHEAEVRPFCSNHSPGRWLEGPQCEACGALLGDTAPARAPPAPVPPPSRRPAAPTTTPPPTVRARPAEHSRRGYPGSDVDAARAAMIRRWREALLSSSARARRAPEEPEPHSYDAAPIVRGVGGCLVRLVVMLIVLVIGFVGAAVLFGGSLLRML